MKKISNVQRTLFWLDTIASFAVLNTKWVRQKKEFWNRTWFDILIKECFIQWDKYGNFSLFFNNENNYNICGFWKKLSLIWLAAFHSIFSLQIVIWNNFLCLLKNFYLFSVKYEYMLLVGAIFFFIQLCCS